jgi:hypothetical protein
MRNSLHHLSKLSKLSLVTCFFFSFIAVASNIYVVSPWSTNTLSILLLSILYLIIGALLLYSISLFIGGAILFFLGGWREQSLKILFTAICCGAILIGGFVISKQVRAYGFHKLAVRSTPLIQAIREYSIKYGRPPQDLNSLVPEYLPYVPQTGIGAYPQYNYGVSDLASENNAQGDAWMIVIDTPSAMINFDVFIYLPNQDYVSAGREYTGLVERIDDWAYIHD